MQINVSQLLREPIGSTRNYQVNEVVDIAGNEKGSLVQGEADLLRTQRSILAKCKLSSDIELTCSRCLSRFHYPLNLNIEEEYFPTVDVVSGAPVPPPEEPGAFTIDGHHILDLTEAVRQYTLMAVPMKPLCHRDCAGLCQNCGHNLNQGSCDCSAPEIDPRWSELTKLL